MTPIIPWIMKCCRNFFSQFKINITTPLSRTSIYFPVTWQWSVTLSSPTSNSLSHIQHLLLNWNNSSSSADMTKLSLQYFLPLFCISHALQEFFNEFINCIFFPAKNNWLAKFIINTHKLVKKSARNVWLTFFSVWSIIPSITNVFTTPNFFHIAFQISINLKWHS